MPHGPAPAQDPHGFAQLVAEVFDGDEKAANERIVLERVDAGLAGEKLEAEDAIARLLARHEAANAPREEHLKTVNIQLRDASAEPCAITAVYRDPDGYTFVGPYGEAHVTEKQFPEWRSVKWAILRATRQMPEPKRGAWGEIAARIAASVAEDRDLGDLGSDEGWARMVVLSMLGQEGRRRNGQRSGRWHLDAPQDIGGLDFRPAEHDIEEARTNPYHHDDADQREHVFLHEAFRYKGELHMPARTVHEEAVTARRRPADLARALKGIGVEVARLSYRPYDGGKRRSGPQVYRVPKAVEDEILAGHVEDDDEADPPAPPARQDRGAA